MRQKAQCPSCGSTRVGPVSSAGPIDAIRELFGSFRARCKDCSTEFRVGGAGVLSVFYAHCPRCLRQDLGSWDENHYHATPWMKLRLTFGANHWRCEVCRCNFVSFRPRLRKFIPVAQRPPEERR